MIALAKDEDLMLKYGLNYNKVNRRINGLKNVIIPGYKSDLKKITEILEEMGRDGFVRLKKTKDLITKKEIS